MKKWKKPYDKIEEIVEKERKGACVILMGDWNAVLGEGEDGRTVGRYGSVANSPLHRVYGGIPNFGGLKTLMKCVSSPKKVLGF